MEGACAPLRDRIFTVASGWKGREESIDSVLVGFTLQVRVGEVDIGRLRLLHRFCKFAVQTDRSFVHLASEHFMFAVWINTAFRVVLYVVSDVMWFVHWAE